MHNRKPKNHTYIYILIRCISYCDTMKMQYSIIFDVDCVESIDEIRGLVSRSAYINELLKKEIKRVDGEKVVKPENDKSVPVKNIDVNIVSQDQAIETEIRRLISSLKNHHKSISEIRMFMKASLATINNIQPGRIITLEELSGLVREEAEKQGVRCID